jgi:hypothetical protein
MSQYAAAFRRERGFDMRFDPFEHPPVEVEATGRVTRKVAPD